jgi:hypothetical protein
MMREVTTHIFFLCQEKKKMGTREEVLGVFGQYWSAKPESRACEEKVNSLQ